MPKNPKSLKTLAIERNLRRMTDYSAPNPQNESRPLLVEMRGGFESGVGSM